MAKETLNNDYTSLERLDPKAYEKYKQDINQVLSNVKLPPRYYQIKALNRMIHYYYTKCDPENPKSKPENLHLLFQLATGAGKTLLMAMLILFLRSKGYTTFVFFVSNISIIEKTKLNFVRQSSSKYLFKNNININGKHINIKELSNLYNTNNVDINIYFSSIHALHIAVGNPTEDNFDLKDFKNLTSPIVLIGDEAHHFNTSTKKNIKTTKQEQENKNSEDIEIRTWESTIQDILATNKHNLLLELTATPEIEIDGISMKYQDKMIITYPLIEFVKDGYAKNISINITRGLDIKERMLLAVLFSQYRKHIATENSILLKPIILFKSQMIKISNDNQQTFIQLIENLTQEQINHIIVNIIERHSTIDPLLNPNMASGQNFISFLKNNSNLLKDIKLDFSREKLINVNNDAELSAKQIDINSLEEPNNLYRAVFAVDKLNEGWDVLNLFDIVKLYETKNAKQNTQEIQLIGRGARYYPFIDNSIPTNEQDKYRQKYDPSEVNPKAIIESLTFHSNDSSEFINQLVDSLHQKGYNIQTEYKTVKMKLTDDFINKITYSNAGIYLNNRQKEIHTISVKIDSTLTRIIEFNDADKCEVLETQVPPKELMDFTVNYDMNKYSIDINVIKESHLSDDNKERTLLFTKAIPYHIFKKALQRTTPNITFDYIKSISDATSIEEFYNEIMVHTKIKFIASELEMLDTKIISNQHKLNASIKTLQAFYNKVRNQIDTEVITGSKVFKSEPIKNLMSTEHELRIKVDAPSTKAKVLAQEVIYCDSNYEIDFVKEFDKLASDDYDMQGLFDYIYLVRNQLYFKLFNYENGQGFYPDFVILAKKSKNHKNYNNKKVYTQIFSEMKGEHLSIYDEWKEKLLNSITPDNIPLENQNATHPNKDLISILGLDFYTLNNKEKFMDKLKSTLINDI